MERISRRQLVRDAGAAVAMTLAAPSVRAQTGGQTLRFVAQADLKILDPIWTTAYITRNHGYLVYDTLFGTDDDAVTFRDGAAIGMGEIPDHYERCSGHPVPRVSGALAAPSWGEIQCHSTRTYRAVICSLAPPAH
jgi:hypothetical protein